MGNRAGNQIKNHKQGDCVMMAKEDRRILNELATRVRQRFPDARVWAFGSRARGDARWDSDFDVCIVLDDLDRKKDQYIREVAWEVSFETGCVITTVVFDVDQFERGPMSESTLVANIMNGGIAA
jgi:predicted nucleotidyltransferase